MAIAQHRPLRQGLKARLWPGMRGFGCKPARVAGFVPVIFVCLVIGLAYYVAVPSVLVPMLHLHASVAITLLILFHFVYLNVIVNYLFLIFADPGGLPDDWKALPPPYMAVAPTERDNPLASLPSQDDMHDLDIEEQLSIQKHPLLFHRSEPLPAPTAAPDVFPHLHQMVERTFDGRHRYCRQCKHYKADRAHHCRVCGRCILRMDHHCVFINNCVGFLNHKYFVSFIAYAFIGCLSVCIISLPTFLEVVGESTRSASPSSRHGATLASPHQFDSQAIGPAPIFTAVFVVGYILTSAFACALCGFVLFHAYLVYKGRTTIEMCDIVDPARAGAIARFDLGGRANCLAVFGHSPICWPFPTRYGIEGDGLTYQRSSCYPGARDEEITSPERV